MWLFMYFFLHEVVITSFLNLLNFHLKNRQCSLHRCWLLVVIVKLKDRHTAILNMNDFIVSNS
uniref:Uncharacterized protein n=1 Tax=Arundo donax TaxID=35708 RepID=A0A0A9ESK2_ARUDO